MSATELIKQVAALPRQERTLFEQLLREMENGAGTPAKLTGPSGPISVSARTTFMVTRSRRTRRALLMRDAGAADGCLF